MTSSSQNTSRTQIQGYGPVIVKKIIALRAINPDDRAAMEGLLDTNEAAPGS